MIKLDAFQLKCFAIVAMVLNHMTVTWWNLLPMWLIFPMYAIGGATFPIMAFFVVEGYRHTSSLKKYILRLFIFALIATPFHFMALVMPLSGGILLAYPYLNILYSIIASLLVLVLYDKIKIKLLFWLLIFPIIAVLSFFLLEWYFVSITTVLLFHVINNEKARRIVPPLVAGVLWLGLGFVSGSMPLEVFGDMDILITNPDLYRVMPTFAIGCVIAGLLLMGFTGERGRRMKWLFYAFYPSHLALLWAGAMLFRALGWM
ncbi:MAG: conjugal transfer protein TraX [Defluviitaleaceae bacterium]|nr:conjugal transfer protein TraX [Defluviitaleaceae bacterium]